MIKYNIIAGVAENLVIGNKNEIPWHISEDLKLFKKLTTGNILIMGRKTFESIGRPLPGRISIVITKDGATFKEKYFKMEMPKQTELFCASTISGAFQLASEVDRDHKKEIFITGGASIYRSTIDDAQKLYISRIPLKPEGDTFFPEFRNVNWILEKTEDFDDFSLEIYRRR